MKRRLRRKRIQTTAALKDKRQKTKTNNNMNIIEFITKLFGNKAQKDMREVQPYVDMVKEVYPEIDALSNDDLRARSQALMATTQGRPKTSLILPTCCSRFGRPFSSASRFSLLRSALGTPP